MKSALSQATFNFVSQNCLIYGTCWEDPAIDRRALTIGPDDTMLVITSAGCNVLDYALCSPKRIFAVDVNPRQNALLELRIAGIRELHHDDFFRIFGYGAHPGFPALYTRRLRQYLSPFARSYWDRRTHWFVGRPQVRGSFYLHTLTGWVSVLCHALMSRHRECLEHLYTAETVEEQRTIWDEEVKPKLWSPLMRRIASQQLFMTAMGVPASQTRELHGAHDGTPAGYVIACMDKVFHQLPLATNYFWQFLLRNGTYSRRCCPEYLTESGFRALKGGLVDRIEVHSATIENFLRERDDVAISKYVLLDHMDWMDEHSLGREWQQTIRRATPKARAIFRTVRNRSEMLDGVMIPANGHGPTRLVERLSFNQELAEQLHDVCRVGTYRAFYIADFEGAAA